MKVVAFDRDSKIVQRIFLGVYEPKINKERRVIVHANGKVFGVVEAESNDYILVEDHIPVEVGDIVTDDIKDYDLKNRYDDDFTMEDVKDVVEEGIEKIKETIKEDKDD